MSGKYPLLLLVSIIIGLVISSCAGSSVQTPVFGFEEQGVTPQPPERFSDLTNPLNDDEGAVIAGGELFQANCSSCHGINGEGDGVAARGLEPPPKNLARNQPSLSDAYLYWRISDGGLMDPFNSLMPAWRGLMDEEKIWQVITYLRTLGPG
jgi:mono/diheme cytochrome c family protein